MKFDESLGPNFLPWLAQQFFVPVIVFFALAASPDLSQVFSPGVRSAVIENCESMGVACVAAFLLAILANHVFPRFAEDGRLIWVLPSTLLIIVLSSDLLRRNNPHALRDYFFPAGVGEDGLAFTFLVIPTHSCIAYSTGVVFARRVFGTKKKI